jgi:hypothetical protein
MTGAERVKSRANQLFAMASEARSQGNHGWAEALTSLASELLDQAAAMEARLHRPHDKCVIEQPVYLSEDPNR